MKSFVAELTAMLQNLGTVRFLRCVGANPHAGTGKAGLCAGAEQGSAPLDSVPESPLARALPKAELARSGKAVQILSERVRMCTT